MIHQPWVKETPEELVNQSQGLCFPSLLKYLIVFTETIWQKTETGPVKISTILGISEPVEKVGNVMKNLDQWIYTIIIVLQLCPSFSDECIQLCHRRGKKLEFRSISNFQCMENSRVFANMNSAFFLSSCLLAI